MTTHDQIIAFVTQRLDQLMDENQAAWVALYRLLLDYIYGVPRITDSNRLERGIWRERAMQIEQALAHAMKVKPEEVSVGLDVLMRELYPADTQRMNPIGIAFACSVVHVIKRFAAGSYVWKFEAKIGTEVFPNLTGFRRRSVDIAAFRQGKLFAIISTKWGIRHDRVRDPQEEADTYKREEPTIKFFVVTNEYDSARLQKVLTYPTIDGVFHVHRDLVWQVYEGKTDELANLKDLTDLIGYFP